MQNLKPVASLYSCAGQFESYLVANPEDRFSRDEAYIITWYSQLHIHFSVNWLELLLQLRVKD